MSPYFTYLCYFINEIIRKHSVNKEKHFNKIKTKIKVPSTVRFFAFMNTVVASNWHESEVMTASETFREIVWIQ